MRLRHRAAGTATVVLAAATAFVALSAPPAHAGLDAPLVANRGFGDRSNVYSWSMAWFKGKLYVGTARDEACVENITVDYFLKVSERYVTRPLPNTRCPRNPYDMDLRAEIWQYTPQTGRWVRVYRSPADIRNPRAKGKTIARDIAFRGMVVDRHAKGGPTLYVGDVTADEYLPELKRPHPPRILATRDGHHFRSIEAKDVVVRMPYGDFRPIGFRSLKIWKGELYATLTPGLTGDGAVFHIKRPWSDKPVFRQISPKRLAIFETEVYDGSLYLGTGDREKGYGVWRLSGRPGGYRLRPIVTDGAGRGFLATSVVSMHVFRGELYVGSSGWYNERELPISELIRLNGSGSWQVVAGAPREAEGRMKKPISGLSDGFNNIFAAHFWRMEDYHGALYVGTNDWSWIVQSALPGVEQWLATAVQSALLGEMGFDIWSSCDGRDWFPVTRDAFGTNSYDFGARNMVATPSGLFIGSANHAEGTKVWRTHVSQCDSFISPAGRPHKAKRHDGKGKRHDGKGKRHGGKGKRHGGKGKGQHHGKVPRSAVTADGPTLAWRASPGAARYQVLRATFQSVPLNLQKPFVFPNGFLAEDQVPIVVPHPTADSTRFDLPIMGQFAPVATTTDNRFTDATAQAGTTYAYEVIAESASGERAAPSGVAVISGGDGDPAGPEVIPPVPATGGG